MSSYGGEAPAPAPAAAPVSEGSPPPAKKKREGVKMSEKQKGDLTKHMAKMTKGGMSPSEAKSHRMKMMGRMRKGMTVGKAHKDIMK
tara:strand:+ start:599 stop:859 length:261 start_codon:yes stop_codon:yes gene_type:complete